MRKIQFTVILILSLLYAGAAHAAISDSLLAKISIEKDVYVKAQLYNELAESINRSDFILAQEYAGKALSISLRYNFQEEEFNAINTIAYMKMLQGNIDTALVMIHSVLDRMDPSSLRLVQGKLHHHLGLAYQLQGDYVNSLIYYHKALVINEEIGEISQILRQLNNMSIVRRELKDYKLAFDYLEQCSSLAKEQKDSVLIWYTEVNKGYILLDQEKYEEALACVLPIVDDEKMNKDTFGMSTSRNILAQIYLGLEDFPKAMENANKALQWSTQIDFNDGIVPAMSTRSFINYTNGNYVLAKNEALAAIEISGDKKATRYIEKLLSVITKSYDKIGNYQKASLYKDRLMEVQESIFNVEKQSLAYKMDIDFHTKVKESENEILRTKVALNDALISKQSKLNLVISILGLFAFLLGFVMYKLWTRRKREAVKLEAAVLERTQELETKNTELIEANKEIETFAYVVSHDLKEPLRNIISFNGLLDKKLYSNPELRDYTKFINLAAEQQQLLIDTILEFSTVRNIQLNNLESVNTQSVLEKVLKNLPEGDKKKVLFDVTKTPQVKGLEPLIHMVFSKLISNALMYNNSDVAKVEISSRNVGDFVEFKISDNGIGIDEKYHESIFDMFTRLNKRSDYIGSGLGLATARKIVNSHNGVIRVESKVGEGAIFFFTLKKAG